MFSGWPAGGEMGPPGLIAIAHYTPSRAHGPLRVFDSDVTAVIKHRGDLCLRRCLMFENYFCQVDSAPEL